MTDDDDIRQREKTILARYTMCRRASIDIVLYYILFKIWFASKAISVVLYNFHCFPQKITAQPRRWPCACAHAILTLYKQKE